MSALKSVFSRQLSVFSLLFLLFIANLFIFTPPVSAADAPCDVKIAGFCVLSEKNYDDEVSIQRLVRNGLVAGHVAVVGTNPMGGTVYTEKAITNPQGETTFVPGLSPGNTDNGALAVTTNTIASLYNPPTSSVEYLANFGENIGLSPKSAYAQDVDGSGASVITPVLKLWQAMRNIAYLGFILVFIAAGVMIMFRQKLNPQTVIGIQQALPGIVIGLILVTFSYFIAALIVDLSFVGTRLVAGLFISTGEKNYYGCTVLNSSAQKCVNANGRDDNADILNETAKNPDAFKMYGKAGMRVSNFYDVFSQIYGSFSPTPDSTNKNNIELIDFFNPHALGQKVGSNIKNGLGGVIGMFLSTSYNVTASVLAGTAASLGSILIPLILAIALMIQFIRLIIALLMSYLQILLMVIFGPILIMVSAIPGRGGTLNYWLKGLLANALVFPAVFAGFLFAGMLLEWNAGALSGAAMPLFGGLSAEILKSVLAFGVLLGLPSIPDMVREAFGVKAPQGFMQAAIGGFMGGVGGAQAGYSQAMQRTGLQGRKEAMEKAHIENQARNYGTVATTPQTLGQRILSWVPNARRS